MIVSVIVLVIGSGYSPACEPFSALGTLPTRCGGRDRAVNGELGPRWDG